MTIKGLKKGEENLFVNLLIDTGITPAPTSMSRPSLTGLMCIKGKDRDMNLIDEISSKYWEFGVQLLNDEDGNYTSGIVDQFRGDFKSINLRILTEWINGRKNAKPCTWWSLVETLSDIGLKKIGREIEEYLLSK